MAWNEKYDKYILFLISLIAFLSVIWVREADIMEARNFITAREMLKNNSWWITTLNGNLRFEKPPLPTWITALWMKSLSNQSMESILRIPNSIFASVFIVYFYSQIKEIFKSRNIAFLSAFVLATNFMFIKLGAENTWDIYVYIFSFLAGLKYFLFLENKKLKNIVIFSIFVALSVLSKGPVGLYSTIIPAIFVSIVISKEKVKKNWKCITIFLLLGILIGSSWGLSMYFTFGEEFLKILAKEKDTWTNSHTKGPLFYMDYIIYSGTWLVFSIASLFYERKNKSEKSRAFYLWHIFIFIFISLVQMKKKRYGLPLYFTESILIGIFLERISVKLDSSLQKILKIQKYILLFIIILSILFLSYSFFVENYINNYFFIVAIIVNLLMFYYLYFYKKEEKYFKNIVIGTGLVMLTFNLTVAWVGDRYYLKNTESLKKSYLEDILVKDLSIISSEFLIEDVWKIGGEIKKMEEIPTDERILYFGDKNLEKLLINYDIVRTYNPKENIKIYELYRKEKI